MWSRSRLILANRFSLCLLLFVLVILSIFLSSDQSKLVYPYVSLFDNDWKLISDKKQLNLTPIEETLTRIEDTSIWCSIFDSHLNFEKYLPLSPTIHAPTTNETSITRLPYRYSSWQSSPKLSRENGFTRCEHFLVMNLLLIIEKICRRNQIRMILSSGTLLGSWRHHDIIPWDDDVDVMIPYEYRQDFLQSLHEFNQKLIDHRIYGSRAKNSEYLKVFYAHTKPAGNRSWKFPFVDIFFYKTNESHFWEMTDIPKAIALDDVFPLVLRPLGELWLPTPRHPEKFLLFDYLNKCAGHYWNHREETRMASHTVKCDELKSFYPFVYRLNGSKSIETLKLNDSIIHSIIFPYENLGFH